jgi:hypothetical protein
MSTVFEECTTKKHRSVVRFSVGLKIFTKKCFLFTVGTVCCVKQFSLGSTRSNDEEVETDMRNWLRQQSKDFYALVKRWDKCISVGGGYVEK